jgi:hypothetical protein
VSGDEVSADDGLGEGGGHVRITSTSKGETWSVTVPVGASLEAVELARRIAREIADRLSPGQKSLSTEMVSVRQVD